jgi:hypothetical protein
MICNHAGRRTSLQLAKGSDHVVDASGLVVSRLGSESVSKPSRAYSSRTAKLNRLRTCTGSAWYASRFERLKSQLSRLISIFGYTFFKWNFETCVRLFVLQKLAASRPAFRWLLSCHSYMYFSSTYCIHHFIYGLCPVGMIIKLRFTEMMTNTMDREWEIRRYWQHTVHPTVTRGDPKD